MLVPVDARVSKFSVSGEPKEVIEPLLVSADEEGGFPRSSDEVTNAVTKTKSKAACRCLKADPTVVGELETRLGR